MADFAKLAHIDTEIEGNMLAERLKTAGILSYVQQVGEVRPKIYSGGFSSPNGADIYVASENLDKAQELLKDWNTVQMDDAALGEEASGVREIPQDVLEYLEEIKKDKRQSTASRMIWSNNVRVVSRIFSIIVVILFVVFMVLSMVLNQ